MKNRKLYLKMTFAAVCLFLVQAAFAQKNLGPAVKRLANSPAERSALADMFKASSRIKESVKKAAGGALLPGNENLLSSLKKSKAAAKVELDAAASANISNIIEEARRLNAASFKVDTRVFLTDRFRSHFSGKENPIVFVNIGKEASVGMLELFDKLGNVMTRRRMYVQTEDGGLIMLYRSEEEDLASPLQSILSTISASKKYNYVQAFNLQTKKLYLFAGKDRQGLMSLNEKNQAELARVLGQDKTVGLWNAYPLTPMAKVKAVRFMQTQVHGQDPSAAIVVLESKNIHKLAEQFPAQQAVLLKITTPFASQDLTNTVWNHFSAENLAWEQQTFFQRGDFGDDVLLQTATEKLRPLLKYDYRLIVHSSR